MSLESCSATFGRPIPVQQCNTAQDALAIAAQTRARIKSGYPQPVSWRNLETMQAELADLRAERNFIKDERDHYRALSENQKETNERLTKEVLQLRAKLQMVPPDKTQVSTLPKRKLPIEKIQLAVCGFYQVSRIDLLGSRRGESIVHPRHVAMYLAREYTGKETTFIGRMFGDKDHSTVINAHKKIKALRANNIQVDNDITRILARLSDTSETLCSGVASQSNEATPCPTSLT